MVISNCMETSITKIQEIFQELRVSEVMTKNIITVTPQDSMRHVQELLRVHRISGTPVLQDQKLIGIVSIMDLIRALEAGCIEQSVAEWMTTQVDVLYADEHITSAIRKLQRTGFGRFPVVDRNTDQMIGILTQGDIIKGTLKQLDIDYRQREVSSYRSQHFFEDISSEETRILLRYTVQAQDFHHAGEASSRFKRSLQSLGVHPSVLRRIAVATYEAEMNLVLHTVSGGCIRADIHQEHIQIDVYDHGPGIPDIDQAMQPGFSTAPEWIRELGFGAGMGLSNILNCADQMSLSSQMGKGTHLEMQFSLKEEHKV